MGIRAAEQWTRRDFLGGLTFAGAAGLLGMRPAPAAAEPPTDTTKLRVVHGPSICQAPQYVADALLQAEGFNEVHYSRREPGKIPEALASGQADITMLFVGPFLLRVDAGDPVVLLAGGHVGCLELFGTDRVRAIKDLKGKAVAVTALGGPSHVSLAIMATHVGLDPHKDIRWVVQPGPETVRLLAEGKVDALMSAPPETQELRARKIGHVVVNTSVDRPWSQYFCCMVVGNREFVRKHPVATKRALRAILKGADMCALEPDRIARSLVARGLTTRYDYAFQAMKEVPYGRWREYDPEDTVRFYALRLHEAGMIKNTPQKIIAQGTDWRFLNELKKELKG